MKLSRRALLGAIAATPLLPAVVSAAPLRAPYVEKDDDVSSIIWHIWEDQRERPPVGPLFVHEVLPWDGNGYPIVMYRAGWRVEDREFVHGYYDFEFSQLRRDVPKYFWHDPANADYPNVHSYVREQRFGEPPAVMRGYMERNRLTDTCDLSVEQMRAELRKYIPPHLYERWV